MSGLTFDILIKKGKVVDGTGNPWFKADVALSDGVIAEVSRVGLSGGDRVIDASGLIISPGFIDCHSHTQNTIFEHPRCESAIRQGITSVATGNCGAGFAPITDNYREGVRQMLLRNSDRPEEVVVDWLTLEEWRSRLEKQGIGVNIIPLTGSDVIRWSILEPAKWQTFYMPNEEEMEAMKRLMASAMEDGSFGIGAKLSVYSPVYPEEMIELCKVAALYGGVFDIHMRSATNTATAVINSVKEIIMIAEKAGVVTNISHLRNYAGCGRMGEILNLLKEARKRGVEITCDIFPWNYGMVTNPTSLFFEGGLRLHGHYDHKITLEDFLNQLRDEESWEKLKNGLEKRYESQIEKNKRANIELKKHGVVGAWYRHPRFMSLVHSKTHPEYTDMTFDEIADEMGRADWKEAIRQILIDDNGDTRASLGAVCEEDIISVLSYPYSAIECDFSHRDYPAPAIRPSHPRGYGNFTRVLGKYVREEGILSLADAVRKMTSLSTTWLGIKDRGLIRKGLKADITVFNPQTVRARATYQNPYAYAEGIEYVIINGKLIIDKGEHTGILAGKALKHSS